MIMKVYGLTAYGPLRSFENISSIVSRKLYRSREAAEAAMEAFSQACLVDPPDRPSFNTLREVKKVHVIEYDLEDPCEPPRFAAIDPFNP